MYSLKLLTGVLLLAVTFSVFGQGQKEDQFPYLGEELEYKISYGGWFPLGTARATIDSTLSKKNGIKYFNANLRAKTAWYLSFVKNIDDLYSSQLRANDLKPIYSEVHTTKGGEKWDQINLFNYDSMEVKIEGQTNNPEKQRYKEWLLPLNDRTYDIMGSYLFFRDLDWDSFKKGDSVMISTLEDHKIWDFGIEFDGREEVKFEGEKYNAYRVIVLFPITRTFTEEKAVLFWVIEKDGVKLPIRIEANMRVGKMVCEITMFKGKYESF
ncbi:DUF3108 domain-containing protein [Marinoscillum sp. MHG1-6]|uniref:DUF3108 domain-containing protein n=1 Tax=Marinoscillum sp. MHG1-6 TaxID=2959627 RepID=UPI00215882F6|nr:DUF3108 domain-containing protein [Marinoscillum sp. MHG1-6]